MSDTRASYRAFPKWSSRFWTWLTGKPEQNQKPLLMTTPTVYALAAVGTYVGGLTMAVMALKSYGVYKVAAVILGWALAVNGARRMVSTVAHQCIHRRFSGNVKSDFAVAQCMAILTLTQSASDYHVEHFRLHHHHAVFASRSDPAVEFLHRAGFRAGLSVRSLWLRLALTLVSPRFHAMFLWSRLHSLLRGLSLKGRLLVSLLWGAILGFASLYGNAFANLFAVIVPVTVLYQNSVLLEFISEHAWFVSAGDLAWPKHIHATHSWGRFCGRRTPQNVRGSRIPVAIRWLLWTLEHILYHLPVRVAVLPGDLSQHDFHHRNPATMRWTQATYAREDDVHDGDSRWPHYREFWGLHNAITHVFEGISKAKA